MARGTFDEGPSVKLALGDLRFGEDLPPTSTTNEPFLGLVDEILVARRCLTAREIVALIMGEIPSGEPCLDFEDPVADPPELVVLGRPPGAALRQWIVNFESSAAGGCHLSVS